MQASKRQQPAIETAAMSYTLIQSTRIYSSALLIGSRACKSRIAGHCPLRGFPTKGKSENTQVLSVRNAAKRTLRRQSHLFFGLIGVYLPSSSTITNPQFDDRGQCQKRLGHGSACKMNALDFYVLNAVSKSPSESSQWIQFSSRGVIKRQRSRASTSLISLQGKSELQRCLHPCL